MEQRKFQITIMTIKDVMTVAEATDIWDLGESTIRKSIERDRFKSDEHRKSKGTWLVTKNGMERLFGKIK